jgi:hypothetical protein
MHIIAGERNGTIGGTWPSVWSSVHEAPVPESVPYESRIAKDEVKSTSLKTRHYNGLK